MITYVLRCVIYTFYPIFLFLSGCKIAYIAVLPSRLPFFLFLYLILIYSLFIIFLFSPSLYFKNPSCRLLGINCVSGSILGVFHELILISSSPEADWAGKVKLFQYFSHFKICNKHHFLGCQTRSIT